MAGLSCCSRLGRTAVNAVGPLTVTIEIERMPCDLEGVYIGNHLLDILDARVTELEDLLTIQAYQVVVLSKEERGLIFGL